MIIAIVTIDGQTCIDIGVVVNPLNRSGVISIGIHMQGRNKVGPQ